MLPNCDPCVVELVNSRRFGDQLMVAEPGHFLSNIGVGFDLLCLIVIENL